MRGESQLLIGGEARQIKFGVASLPVYEQVFGMSVYQVLKLFIPKETTEQPSENDVAVLTDHYMNIIKLLYVGLLTRKKVNNLPAGFDIDQLLEWVDDALETTSFIDISKAVTAAFVEGISIFTKDIEPKGEGEPLPTLTT